MTKKKITYKLYPNVKGDLYTDVPPFRKDGSGKFILDNELTQQELEYLYQKDHKQIVYKIEG